MSNDQLLLNSPTEDRRRGGLPRSDGTLARCAVPSLTVRSESE